MPRWTKEQEEAIYTSGKNIIVSAGAGSGKTAVLSERVLHKIEEGTHVNELLILTYIFIFTELTSYIFIIHLFGIYIKFCIKYFISCFFYFRFYYII